MSPVSGWERNGSVGAGAGSRQLGLTAAPFPGPLSGPLSSSVKWVSIEVLGGLWPGL